jgi:uncharacterized protein CbrC (UPF0167 family)
MNLLVRIFGKRVLFNYAGTTLPKNINLINYYTKEVTCNNCGKRLPLLIRKGIYAKYAITEILCDNCNCKVDK